MAQQADIYVIFHILTTCDDHGVSVSKDQLEAIEVSWIFLDSKTFDSIHHHQLLIKPTKTPITPLCTSLTNLSWDHVRNSGTFQESILTFTSLVQTEILDKGLSFVFVTFNSWDLKVQLPREARDKNVVLPSYLQYPRVFDLKLEYQKWQQYHPESLGFGSSNVINVCNALDVELEAVKKYLIQLSSTNANAVSLPANDESSKSSANNNTSYFFPKRALEHVFVFKAALVQLIKRSKAHKDVLSKPFDLGYDIKTFLIEKSRVLYMNNLPYDTTQSELESWFTRYGGRPIAFRTLQTPDPHKLLGSGFAIFATHESATESLAMNGRSLNERCIEVQPSSFKLLDFAQEILIPFPLSKNRSRPGDWTCPSCGFSNFQRRTACLRCSFPAASAVTIQESLFNKGMGDNSNDKSGNSGDNNMYNNANTINLNNNNNAKGVIYGGVPPSFNGFQQHNNINNNNVNNNNNNRTIGNINTVVNHNHLAGASNVNGINNKSYGHNNAIPFRAGDWKCENCLYHNFAKNMYCLRCGMTRITKYGALAGNMPPQGYHMGVTGAGPNVINREEDQLSRSMGALSVTVLNKAIGGLSRNN